MAGVGERSGESAVSPERATVAASHEGAGRFRCVAQVVVLKHPDPRGFASA